MFVNIKSEHKNSSLIRDLRGVLVRKEAAIGVFITFDLPTGEMTREVLSAG